MASILLQVAADLLPGPALRAAGRSTLGLGPPTADVTRRHELPVWPSVDTLASILLLLLLLYGVIGTCIFALRAAYPSPSGWAYLTAAIVVAAAMLRFWIPSHHAMYVDEPWYLEAAANLLRRGALLLCERTSDGVACSPYPKAAGWPVLLAAGFAVAGFGSQVAFNLSTVFSIAAVPLAAAVVRLAGGAWSQAAVAALLIAVHPLHVAWSATAETNAPSTGIGLAGVAGVLLVRRRASLGAAALAGGGLGLAAAMRPELALVALSAAVALSWSRGAAAWRDVIIVAIGAVLGTTSVIASWALYIANSQGAFLALSNVTPNFLRVVEPGEGGRVTILILILSAVGFIASFRRAPVAAGMLASGSMLSALAALAYDQRIFYTRTLLGSLVLLVPLAALAIPAVEGNAEPRVRATMRAGIALVVCILALQLAVLALRQLPGLTDVQLLETRLPSAVAGAALPDDAVVIAEWPTVLATETTVTATAAKHVRTDGDNLSRAAAEQPHFLLCDMFCERGFAGSEPSVCEQILGTFEMEEVAFVADARRRFGLYRLVRPAGPGSAKAPCPFPGQ